MSRMNQMINNIYLLTEDQMSKDEKRNMIDGILATRVRFAEIGNEIMDELDKEIPKYKELDKSIGENRKKAAGE